MAGSERKPGRPRDPRLQDALLQAGLEVFMEQGYGSASLAEIARRAGVGTPAIYRRWPTKAQMAIDIFKHVAEPEPIPDTGSIRDDLVTFVAQRSRIWATPLFRKLVFPLLLEGGSEESLATDVAAHFRDYRRALVARVERSIEAGELRSGTDPGRLLDLLMGTLTIPLLFFLEIPGEDKAAVIVDEVLAGFGAS